METNKIKLSDTLTLYQRDDTKHDYWYVAIKLPKLVKGARTAYKRLSTETSDVEAAKARAFQEEQRVGFKQELGIPVHTKSFERAYTEWLDSLTHKSKGVVASHRANGLLYFFDYFNQRELGMIDDVFIEDYWVWRQKINSIREQEGKLTRHQKTRVSPATLYAEKNSLNQFFKWAAKRNLIKRKFDMELPVPNERNRRPTFTLEEMKILVRASRSWAKGIDPYIQQQQFYQRQLIRFAFLFATKSGLRNKELFKLRWKDISFFYDEAGTKQMLIHVSPDTKTGARDTVPLLSAIPLLEKWRNGTMVDGSFYGLARHTEPDDYIFGNWWGSLYRAHHRRLKDMFEDTGVLFDRNGKERTFYAARHFYATNRLLYGDGVEVYDLAKNMGTSVEMIEKHYGHVVNQQNAVKLTSKRKPFTRKRIYNNVIDEDNLIPFPQKKSA